MTVYGPLSPKYGREGRPVSRRLDGMCIDCGAPVRKRGTRCSDCFHGSRRGVPLRPDPSADAAHGAVKRALARGEIVRPEACPECGATERRIEAHHHRGYAPEFHLDIIWLCTPCHQALHTLPTRPVEVIRKKRKPRNTSSKLTNEQADEVIARHVAGESYRRIARDYGVHAMTIQRIVKGRTYVEE